MVQNNLGNMVRDETIQSRQEPGYGGPARRNIRESGCALNCVGREKRSN